MSVIKSFIKRLLKATPCAEKASAERPSPGNRKNSLLILAILVFACGLMIYFCGKYKFFYHGDEVFSYGSSNCPYGAWIKLPVNAWSGKEVWQEYVTVSPDSRFNILQARRNQGDDVHPPVYYMFLHCICSFFPGVFSRWFGLGLNIAAMLLSIYLLYRIMKQIVRGGADVHCAVSRLLLCGVLRHNAEGHVHKNVHSAAGFYSDGSVSAP